MLFSLDVLRARKGDCLLLHYGAEDDPRLVLIDGGPAGVYRPHLKPRLGQVRTHRGVPDGRALPIDLMILSHVDDDHANGLLELTRELIDAEDNHRPAPVRILGLWHNSFENVTGKRPDQLLSAMQGQFGPASTEGQLPEDAELDVEGLHPKDVHAGLQVLASIQQGAQLRRDARRLRIGINGDFEDDLIIARADLAPIEMDDHVSFTVVGPLQAEVAKLHDKHEQWLEKLKEKGLSPEEVLSAYLDKSVANLSSLVLLAKAEVDGQAKTILLTGDARGDKILDGLRLTGLLGPDADSTLHVDVLKVPHHGSEHNVETDFFRHVTADHYVFSGDGKHGNPEREALEMLLEARGTDAPYTLHLTYPVDEIDAEREKDWKKEQAKAEKRKAKKPATKVRPDWSPAEHALGGLFAAEPAFGTKVRVVEEGRPHVIDLRQPLGF